ncbi:hypothetical protein IC229_34570 [Spirosoma sp. BT702]|uniref:SH3 domain-containing protein n=1 Tax=Spirosoma profusum TaxID=2771354 RepID=A0A927AWK4_9BACT|nr:hypothetical protein [Spirosoma profusum]MBD2705778.1 hypothetical protein [Spirosoma profusum]
MKAICCWFVGVGLLGISVAPNMAQTHHNPIDITRESAWRSTYSNETAYQRHARSIDYMLTMLGKHMNHLSVVDPAAYCLLQTELHYYLHQLESQQLNYGNQGVFDWVLLRLTELDERIKSMLAQHRRENKEEKPQPALPALCEGQRLSLRPYTLIFRRADYRSQLKHIVLTDKEVTLLKTGDSYHLVQCGSLKGYLHMGMIVSTLP